MGEDMKKLCFLMVLYLCWSCPPLALQAQDLSQFKVTNDRVLVAALDPLHQVYFINDKRQLLKLVPSQNREYLYTDLFIDRQTVIQAQNPFKVLLYKKDVGTLVALDARLNQTARVNMFDLGYFDVSAVATANDNQSVWLFDKASQQLVRLDQNNRQTFFSPVMPQQIGHDLDPVYITETEGRVYVVDPARGIFIFDNIGNYFKSLPIVGLRKVWVFGPRMLYYYEGKIWQYDLMLMDTREVLTLGDYSDVFLSREFILALSHNGELFRLPWPVRP
jgi:hypothetical protein